ncbi:hypothetical protein WJX72_010250 [[Myrmecia] bisecta]|uniref:peptidoglycan glycosyltransferase n=1 Tax=[Myrmecia] bisecta TaxID=41462 RepID=A0AAW1PIA5_9CHLO
MTQARVSLSDSHVSAPVWQAVVSSEDRRFFTHHGVDANGVLRAVLSLGRHGGGSTITQQVVKNLVLSDSRTLSRKVAELALAMLLEAHAPKSHILELYLNHVYYGHGIVGVSQAAAAYFGKQPAQLSTSEAALLAGVLPAPESLSPFRDAQAARRVHAQVISSMVDSGCLHAEHAECIRRAGLPITLASIAQVPAAVGEQTCATPNRRQGAPYRAPFFVNEVLHQVPHLLGTRLQQGLRIYTTLDLPLQEQAEMLLAGYQCDDAEQAVLIAMQPANGAVSVLVGGRDFSQSSFNRATLSRRSPGSALKPVVFLAALASRLVTCSTEVRDEALIFRNDGRGWAAFSHQQLAREQEQAALRRHRTRLHGPLSPGDYCQHGLAGAQAGKDNRTGSQLASAVRLTDEVEYEPHNFNRQFRGAVTVGQALVHSLNIPAVWLANMVGVDAVVDMAQMLGITSPLPRTLALALGACEVTPLELATVYNTLAARGIRSQPFCVSRIEDATGNVLYSHKQARTRVVGSDACCSLGRMLRDAVQHGTGRAAGSGWPSEHAAGKTGTSDDYRDAWFAGFSPSLTCVVWVGRDDNMPLQGTGATLAAPLWARFMQRAHRAGTCMPPRTSRPHSCKF